MSKDEKSKEEPKRIKAKPKPDKSIMMTLGETDRKKFTEKNTQKRKRRK